MSSYYGNKLHLSIFGQSHAPAIGVTIDGLPAGIRIDREELQRFMDRRAPGRSKYATPRKEADAPEFITGLVGDTTCGTAVTAIIRNTNTKPGDYSNIRDIPRPGHADYTAHVKYGGQEDGSGGGAFSGRMTAPLCIAGGIALQYLAEKGITVEAKITEIGGSTEDPYGAIDKAMAKGDSVGGIIECRIAGVPVGYGGPLFEGIEGQIAQMIFAIPAVKGIEFGAGFEAARMLGSENNDEFYYDENGKVATRTNNAGGILGGISSGMDITFRVAIKPTPSIAQEQKSISYSTGENATLEVRGRHDPCIVPRAVPVIEAGAAVVIMDLLLADNK